MAGLDSISATRTRDRGLKGIGSDMDGDRTCPREPLLSVACSLVSAREATGDLNSKKDESGRRSCAGYVLLKTISSMPHLNAMPERVWACPEACQRLSCWKQGTWCCLATSAGCTCAAQSSSVMPRLKLAPDARGPWRPAICCRSGYAFTKMLLTACKRSASTARPAAQRERLAPPASLHFRRRAHRR